MTWTILPGAIADYLRLCLQDPRGPRTDWVTLTAELRATCDRLEREKEGHPRHDGRLVYRGPKSRRYQYIVDAGQAPPVLVQVRGESEKRTQGSAGTLGHEIRRRRERK